MSTHDDAVASVVEELWEAVPEEYRDAPGLALNVAARLVLAARRERDAALALRGLGSELAAQSTSTLKEIARLTAALARANAGFEEYERKFYLVSDERDAAIQERDRLRAELDAGDTLRRTNAERERDAAIAEVGKVSRQLGFCEVERDVAVQERDAALSEAEANLDDSARWHAEMQGAIADLREADADYDRIRELTKARIAELEQQLRAALEGK